MFGLFRSPATVNLADLMPRIAAGEVILIDVRDPTELQMGGRAAGALNIPLMRLPMMADPRHPDFHPDLSPDKPVALYCASGARSAHGKALLQRLGYGEVHNIGGFGDWQAAGGATCR